MSKSRKSFLLRIEPELYEQLEALAQQELRSVNGQIEYLLKQAVAKRVISAQDRRTAELTQEERQPPAK